MSFQVLWGIWDFASAGFCFGYSKWFSSREIILIVGNSLCFNRLYFKVPVAVQPLKAMAVIAIAKGFSMEMLSITAFFYGILLLILSITELINFLQRVFTPGLVRGVQLGIGLILAQKAIQLVVEKGILLNFTGSSLSINILLLICNCDYFNISI